MERPKEYETRLKSRIVVENIISQTAQEQGWRLQARVPDIIRQLALESEKLDCHGKSFRFSSRSSLNRPSRALRGVQPRNSLDELVGESGLSRAVLADMLPVLVNERLVRPIGHERYEIQHDRWPLPSSKL